MTKRMNPQTTTYTVWGNDGTFRDAFARGVRDPAPYIARARRKGLTNVVAVPDDDEDAYWARAARDRDAESYWAADRVSRHNPASMSEAAARTVIAQLGGMGRLSTMVGAYNWLRGYDEHGWPALSFQFKGSKSLNFARITVTPLDVYEVRFGKWYGVKMINVKDFTDVYAEQLRPLFERTTGLYLSM